MIAIGFLAGYIVERATESNHGLFKNVVVGVAGSFFGGFVARTAGISYYGFFANLLVATAGAIIILWLFRRFASGGKG
jgi:uncharacterized membrane protein YeaQ/YmgE (transglycosylase-associated protein family)